MNSILDNEDTITDYVSLMPENQRDPQALAKKAYHADAHIKTLESRMDELRNDYLAEQGVNQTRAKLEELVKRLESSPQPASNPPPIVNEVREPTIDWNQIDSRVSKTVQELEQTKKAEENASLVRSKLQERFGDNYSTTVKQQIDELGWTVADFDAQARKSPKATLRALGLDQQASETFQAPVRGNSNFGQKAEVVKDWNYYQAMKKDNSKLYHDPKITNEMTEMAIKYGDRFYTGDYNRFNDLGR